MNQEFKKEWIEALRSGEYIQGKNVLKRLEDNVIVTHCCLGVACELLKYKLELKEEVESGTSIFNGVYEYLPTKVAEFIDIALEQQENLAWMNDEDYSFEQIATELEKDVY